MGFPPPFRRRRRVGMWMGAFVGMASAPSSCAPSHLRESAHTSAPGVSPRLAKRISPPSEKSTLRLQFPDATRGTNCSDRKANCLARKENSPAFRANDSDLRANFGRRLAIRCKRKVPRLAIGAIFSAGQAMFLAVAVRGRKVRLGHAGTAIRAVSAPVIGFSIGEHCRGS